MFKIRWHKGTALVIATMLSLVGLGVSTQPAYATSDLLYMHYQSGVQGDAVYVDHDGSHCPGDANDVSTVQAVFTDSTNQVFRDHLTNTIAYSGGGLWTQAVWNVPLGASLGAGTLKAECWLNGVVTKEYEKATAFTIVAPTTALSVNDGNDPFIYDTLRVQSSTPCPAGNPYPVYSVSIFIRSTESVSNGAGTQFVTDKFDSIWPLSGSSNWSINIKLNREEFKVGETYSLRAQCGYSSGQQAVDYSSLLFTVQPNKYVAMGDSYSSGEGSFNYDLVGGDCHRSTDSYPYYLVDNIPLDPPYFAACSGAMTDDLFNNNPVNTNEEAQRNYLDDDVEKVTLTIGGNDIGFKPVMEQCAEYIGHSGFGCSTDSTMTTQVADRIGKLAGYGTITAPGNRTIHSYADILTDITTKAPGVKVYIAGYPRFFGENPSDWVSDTNAPGTFKCAVYDGFAFSKAYIDYNDGMWINDRIDDVNLAIKNAVDDFDSPDVEYVPTSTFDGHGLCDSGSPYLNGVVRGGQHGTATVESFHPNVTGMSLGYGAAFASKMN